MATPLMKAGTSAAPAEPAAMSEPAASPEVRPRAASALPIVPNFICSSISSFFADPKPCRRVTTLVESPAMALELVGRAVHQTLG